MKLIVMVIVVAIAAAFLLALVLFSKNLYGLHKDDSDFDDFREK